MKPLSNQTIANLVMGQLATMGVRHVAIAPGSRSTPLTLAAARHDTLETHVHFDERGLAFYALGIAKATREPVAIVTTSGTAVANLLPAVVEAYQSTIPLIVLSADRPERLVGTGANQTITQTGIFSTYLCAEAQLDESFHAEAMVQTVADVTQATWDAMQPSQLNCRFDEPLITDAVPIDVPYRDRVPTQRTLPGVSDEFLDSANGLVMIGELMCVETASAVRAFCDNLGWPVMADVTSMLRTQFEWPDVDITSVERVLHIGGPMTRKVSLDVMKELADRPTVRCCESGRVFNPFGAEQMQRELSHRYAGPSLKKRGQSSTALCKSRGEGKSFPLQLAQQSNAAFFLGNSSVIREFDACDEQLSEIVPTFASRGASGIDGQIATMVGVAWGLQRPVVGVIGDLTFLHDCNSLALMAKSPYPIVLIVKNDNGGGIFEKLSGLAALEEFETYFKTPHGLGIEGIVRGFGIAYGSALPAQVEASMVVEMIC